jgi:hypothetical protein
MLAFQMRSGGLLSALAIAGGVGMGAADCITTVPTGNGAYCDGFGPVDWTPQRNVTHVTVAGNRFNPTYDVLAHKFPDFQV